MTHLSDHELVDLLDGTLAASRREHLRECDACRTQATMLEEVLARAVDAGAVPEPSPLFWDHLSSRVREAIAAPAPSTWRDRVWWQPAAWAAGLASITLAIAISYAVPSPSRLPDGPAGVVVHDRSGMAPVPVRAEATDDLETDEAWALVRTLAEQVEWDDAHDAGFSTRPDAADRMTQELSSREQSELVLLLQHELTRSGT